MRVNLTSIFTSTLGLGLLLASCGGADTSTTANSVDTLAVDTAEKETGLIHVGNRIFSIPAPAQMVLAMRKAGLKYQKNLVTPLDKADAVATKTGQSAVLGIYAADLAYAILHKDGQQAMATLQAVEKLGNKLELSNSFDKAMLDRFKGNLGSEDSLLRFSGEAFRAADESLKQNQRNDVSALILAGGWIEALHLAISDPMAIKDQALVNRIGEQKTSLNAIVELLQISDTANAATSMSTAFKELQGLFNGVSNAYSYQEPVTDAAKKTTFINSTSAVTISADQLTAIMAKVSAIRNMMLA